MAQTGLTWRLAVDLLDKMNNPDNHQHYSEVDDDDLEVMPDFIAYTFKIGTLGNLSLLPEIKKEIKVDNIRLQEMLKRNRHSLSNLILLYFVNSHANTDRLSAVNVNISIACGEVSFAKVCFHVLPFPLFLILFIVIIIPTGINITSMWQPKRWYQCLFKGPLCFSPL